MTTSTGQLTGSAPVQGKLWGAKAQDWAELQEPTELPLHSAVLAAAHAVRGTRLLDAGCGAGTAALLASLRGATVAAIDASEALLAITSDRLPAADIRQADLESLPYSDATFDAVIAVNSVFYATDPASAVRELARVARPGGRIVVTTWGPAARCEYASVIQRMGPLMPPPPPNSKPGGPFAYSEPGVLESLVEQAGLHPVDRGEVSCPFVYPDSETARRAHLSAGVMQRAIEHSGLDAVVAAIDETDANATQPDGSIRYDNVFVWVAAVR